jgi:hypothetical protein
MATTPFLEQNSKTTLNPETSQATIFSIQQQSLFRNYLMKKRLLKQRFTDLDTSERDPILLVTVAQVEGQKQNLQNNEKIISDASLETSTSSDAQSSHSSQGKFH